MKICILIIYSYSEHYLKMKQILEEHYRKYTDYISFYFVQNNETIENDIEFSDNTIVVKKQETLLNIMYKTLKAIEYIYEEHKDMEYLVRTNVSTIIDIHNLIQFLSNIPKQNIYCGGIRYSLYWLDYKSGIYDHRHKGTNFVQGTSIILSIDLVESIIQKQDKINHAIVDDVTIALFIKEFHNSVINESLFKYCAKHIQIDDSNNNIDINSIDNTKDIVFYRNKCSDMNNTVKNMARICEHLTVG